VKDSGTLVDGKSVQPSANEMLINRADDNAGEMVFPGEQWMERTPGSQGFDAGKLNTTLKYLESRCGKDGIQEVVVARNGYLIYQGDRAENRRSTASVGKVFTSTVLGLLIDEGKCTLDTLACDYDPLLKKHYPGVRLRHFATMTSGYDAEGHHKRHVNAVGDGKGDWGSNACAVAQPLFAPGEKYLYYDEAMFMFGRALTAIAQESMKEYFSRRIGDPIGMGDWVWNSGRLVEPINGIAVNWGCGNVHVNAKQLARLGHLYLNQGRWKDRQLISRRWVAQATRNQVPTSIGLVTDSRKVDGRGIYGYHWWTQGTSPSKGENLPDAPEGTFYRTGAGRNILFVVPKWNVVIVRLGNDSSSHDWMSTWNEVFKRLGASFIQD
jgi:CubicO group peptidase (beta-lactamase class C family)